MSDDYLLGVNEAELERLRFQHSVWGPVTLDFLKRLGVRPGWKCLDAGSGPGFVSMDLRAIVGAEGEVTALEQSGFYIDWLRTEARKQGWPNLRCIHGKVEEAELPAEEYDLVVSRWVISFSPDPERFLAPLVAALKPGGIIALQDYYYEGISLFPRGGAFDRIPEVVIKYYNSEGGDPYIAGKIPALFRRLGVLLTEFAPHCLAGGPESGIMEWAHRFFTMHMPAMVDRGVVGREDAAAMMADWHAHRSDRNALFFSPLVVDVAGTKGTMGLEK